MKNGTQVRVIHKRFCDVCRMDNHSRIALYDARLNIGTWANVCQEHFDMYNCKLGLGFGQMFIYEDGE